MRLNTIYKQYMILLLISSVLFLSGCQPQETPVVTIMPLLPSAPATQMTETKITETPAPTQAPAREDATLVPSATPSPSATTAMAFFPTLDHSRLILVPPANGYLYHGVYPGGKTGKEDDITPEDLASYESAVGKKAAWVYFSNNWGTSRSFPLETVVWIDQAGSVPFIRLMLRSNMEHFKQDSLFTLQDILEGKFNQDLTSWFNTAKSWGKPLLVEFGTEMNGEWFSWNAKWNGSFSTRHYGDPNEVDGVERFRDAYRHIVKLSRQVGCNNLLWVWHVNDTDSPDKPWNRLESYYPGNEYVDLLAVSVYGEQSPLSDGKPDFVKSLDTVYARLTKLTLDKPILLAEFGSDANNPFTDQVIWAESALNHLFADRWPNVIGFAWWNETWQNDDDPDHDTNMRVQDSPELLRLFRERFDTERLIEDLLIVAD